MGQSRFTEIAGDDFAGGGALKGAPSFALPTSRYTALHLTGMNVSGWQTGTTGNWFIVAIGAATASIVGFQKGAVVFNSHTVNTIALGADFRYGETLTASAVTGMARAFTYFNKDSTHPYYSENGFDCLMRFGAATGISTNHATYIGFCASTTVAPATTIQDVNGAMVEVANLVGWRNNGDVLTAIAAGASGGIQTVYTYPGVPAGNGSFTFNNKFFRLGVRWIGDNKIAWYLNGRKVASHTLAVAVSQTGAGPLQFAISNVSLGSSVTAHQLHFKHLSLVTTIDPVDMFVPPEAPTS